MRRPQPLPPSGVDDAARAAAADDVEAAPRRAPRVPTERTPAAQAPAAGKPDSTDTEPITLPDLTAPADGETLAPVVSLTAPAALPSTRPDVDAADGQAQDAPPEQIRLRDVWSATRARRKALRAEVRRFTVRQRRRRALWLGVTASIVLLILGTLAAAYSPLFAVEQITVVGAQRLDAEAVAESLADQKGTPLPLVDDEEVRVALMAFPFVETYVLEARPPHELVVRIVERTPIGYVETRAGFALVDAAGVELEVVAAPGSDAPTISVSGGVTSDAFDAVGQVMRALPDSIRAQVTAVAATTPDDVTLTLGASGAQIVWGSAEDSAMKAVVLETAMIANPPGAVSFYDVSSAEAIVIR